MVGTNVNPLTASMVPISIKIGGSGRPVQSKELQSLSNKCILLDVTTTWYNAFLSHFNVSVDPQIYSVQRGTSEGPPVKHNLHESIKILMREFKKPRKEFAVYIVENQKIQTKRSPVPRTDAVRKSAPKAGLNHELFIGGGHRYNEKILSSAKKNLLQAQPRYSNVMPSSGTALSNKHNSFSDHRQGERNKRPAQRPPAGMPVTQRPRFAEDDMIFSSNGHNRNGAHNGYDNNDDDNRSDITSASQDSQMEDLHELGIAYEDIKASFCKKAKRNISNTQFLMARNELEQLKKNHSSRWSRWTTAVPITANVVRDLLNV